MSFLITRRPEKLFTGTTKFSRWTGVHNPYNFEFLRQDITVSTIAIRSAYSTTLPTIKTTGSLVPLVSAGDQIYVNCGVYNGVYTVSAVNGAFITLDTPYISIASGGYINMIETFSNYKAYINIYDNVTGNVIDTVYPKPDSTGFLIYDVSGVLRSLINTRTDANQSFINVPNKDISGSFYIGYGATFLFDGDDITSIENVDHEVYYWVSGAKQIDGDISEGMDGIGQNLKEYVPKNISGSEANFLTMFETPTYFEGFPFTLSFLYDEDFDVYLNRHQQDMNVNGVNVGIETDETLLTTGKGYVNQMLVEQPAAGTDSFDVWLEADGSIPNGGGYVVPNYVIPSYVGQFVTPFNP